jgi:Uma2 family endonuclease
MSAAKQLQPISEAEYLAGELASPVKHEYFGGSVYAMAGAKNVHNRIAKNAITALDIRLLDQTCQPFNSDTKIRIQMPTHTRFYYPDCSVVCDENPPDDSWQEKPVVVLEVLSDSTRRVDEKEKKEAYLSIPSLFAYLLVEQETAAVVVHRRTAGGFSRELHQGLDAVIPLPEIGVELPLRELYRRVEFQPEDDGQIR